MSIYGAVSNWCEQCGLTEEEQGPKGVLTSVKSHEVNLLASSPRLASGSSLRGNIQDFESLSERFARVCEDAIFVHRVPAGMTYKTRPDEKDGFGQKAEESEPCLAKSKTSIPETGADTLSVSASQACLFTQRTIPTTERKWKVIPANSSYGGALPTAVSKIVTRVVRRYDQDERQPDAALHWDTITAESVRKTWSTRFLRETLAST